MQSLLRSLSLGKALEPPAGHRSGHLPGDALLGTPLPERPVSGWLAEQQVSPGAADVPGCSPRGGAGSWQARGLRHGAHLQHCPSALGKWLLGTAELSSPNLAPESR